MDFTFLIWVVIGFIAQTIDGALGMAYGVSATTILLGFGVTPVLASASVHTAELFTTGVSGIFHLRFGNVDRTAFKRLAIPGMIGAVIGAYILTSVPGEKIKPFVAIYLAFMGLVIVVRGFERLKPEERIKKGSLLGIVGGFFDAIGGGGWGPIVTSTLVGRGHNPRFAIGTVNLAEFFVTAAQVFVFLLVIQLTQWTIILGLIVGGVIAAPFAAWICKWAQTKWLMIAVGILVFILSAGILVKGNWIAFFT